MELSVLPAVHLRCEEEQHAHILQSRLTRCFCPYCGMELPSVCAAKLHDQKLTSGDRFCITCGTALTDEAKSRREIEREEARKKCVANDHRGVGMARVTQNNTLACLGCDTELPSLEAFVK